MMCVATGQGGDVTGSKVIDALAALGCCGQKPGPGEVPGYLTHIGLACKYMYLR